ncbi:class I SAM-dependent methyltransferase [Mucilaginibacter sp. JRF]|uniref:class I SAM-dependent methyltransferase n=1 Tax=Mucilaginibacter sp. JRF TaxID=2780088 RepID=UPI0018806F0D|nr:class I SAM-dependent methyltransferase [Mucilaginibacter sp. JRF]MBE9584278.1 class I SAM-dependent methyltransferase [Mucilaginibacter sp. JRF]
MTNDKTWLQRWDERYSAAEYAFGEEPNVFLREQLSLIQPSKILFAAEGEGRNAIFAAKSGWDVSAFDISIQGKHKADTLAARHGVSIDYRIGELPELNYLAGEFDAIALIYAHFPAHIKSAYHQLLSTYLKPGGLLILEAFAKNHLEYVLQNEKIGGPRDLASLFSADELLTDFAGYDILQLTEQEVELSEGLYHNGKGWVIRFVGRKLLY